MVAGGDALFRQPRGFDLVSRLPERERGRSGGYEIGSARQLDLMPPPLRCEACGYQPAHTAAAPNGRDVSAAHAARARHRGAKVRRMLSIGRSRVYELIASGDLASVKIGASRRVTIKSIRKLVAGAR